jgi:hypothetical protein
LSVSGAFYRRRFERIPLSARWPISTHVNTPKQTCSPI